MTNNEVSKELLEAAEKYRRDTCNEACKQGFLDSNPSPSIKTAFISGASWMREQMMKNAVEAMVTTNLANRPVIYLDQLKGFQYGDKVKLIIIKEDAE